MTAKAEGWNMPKRLSMDDGETVRVSLRMPDQLLAQVHFHFQDAGLPTTSDTIRYIIERYLEEHDEALTAHRLTADVPPSVKADVNWLVDTAGYGSNNDVVSQAVRDLREKVEQRVDKMDEREAKMKRYLSKAHKDAGIRIGP